MSLKIGDNFSYKARKPLDERLTFPDIATMANTPESILYTGLIAYNLEKNSFYTFNANNPVDPVLGKWTEFYKGKHIVNAAVDTNVGSPTEGHLIIYMDDDSFIDCGNVTGSNIATLAKYEENTQYLKDAVVYCGRQFARIKDDYTSGSIVTTIEDLFHSDSNLVIMSHDTIDDNQAFTDKTYSSEKIEALLQSVSSSFGGAVRTEDDLPTSPNLGTWVLIEDCTTNFPGQGGIGAYTESGWNIVPLPSGTFVFPDTPEDDKLYYRSKSIGDQDGHWVLFTGVDGSEVEVKIKVIDSSDTSFVPAIGELVWDTDRKCLVMGDGVTTAIALKPFYEVTLSDTDIISALGYTPEDIANKGMAYGYAPLDANGKVPAANLPDSSTDTYSKAEIDQKDIDGLAAATLLVNQEATLARAKEQTIQNNLDEHIDNTGIHVTQTEKDTWNNKVEQSDLLPYDNHISDNSIHVTQAEKDKWDGMNKIYYVLDESELPQTGNSVGNLGYVQRTPAGQTPVVCDTFLWTGTQWVQQDVNQVTLQMKWGNLADRPSSTVFAIDNAVAIAHNHTNKDILEKIGQTANGAFTFDGQEIGVRVVFVANESFLPEVGTLDTLYVVYEDSRVRRYPSISVWKDGSFQILGRGTQDAPQMVGDLSILQNEFFSVAANTKQHIKVTQNQYFAFLPIEILKEIPGKTDQNRVIASFDNPDDYDYDMDLINITNNGKLTISIAELPTVIDETKDQYHSSVEVDLTKYRDIGGVM